MYYIQNMIYVYTLFGAPERSSCELLTALEVLLLQQPRQLCWPWKGFLGNGGGCRIFAFIEPEGHVCWILLGHNRSLPWATL